MIVMIGHAIIRHRLMDIRVVIKKGVVYIAAFVAAGAILAGLIVGSSALFPGERWGLSREILLGLFVAVLFHPLKGGIQRGLDRYVYRGTYDYQQTLREVSRKMATMLDLGSLLPYLCDVIGRTMRPDMIKVYLHLTAREDYWLAAARRFAAESTAPEPEAVGDSSSLPQWLRTERTHLLRDDLARGEPDTMMRAALSQLISLGGALAFPIWDEDRLNGVLILGPKLSGDPYFADDTDLLSTLAGQAGIAIKNAQLHQEVVLVNEYIDNILKTMESGVVAVSVERKITLFNPAAERMTGLPAASIRSGPVDQLPPTLAAPIDATLADGESRLQVETTISGITGRATPVICSTSPFRRPDGNILGAVLVFSDLTRLKELEEEDQHRAERLTLFGALASGIAHEIRNPLVAIKTFAQLLPKKFAEENFREDFAKIAVREIDRIEDLLERLRDLSGPSEESLRPLDLREPIEATLELLRGHLEEKRITLRWLYPVAPPPVPGDPRKLEQLFLNLFLNALEAMDPGGELTVRLDTQPGPNAMLRVEVSDTGCGIPETLLARIFEPFVTTKPRGSGLGLAICRAIADAHRATIRAENFASGRGTTMTIEFPAAVGSPEAVEA
ncbi:MAG: PAS domain-containing protein [Candidatus Rokubacteria bacterium]|nr:PAS domain-containing protein [Candidatus Rokubacteria bacterium]